METKISKWCKPLQKCYLHRIESRITAESWIGEFVDSMLSDIQNTWLEINEVVREMVKEGLHTKDFEKVSQDIT